VREALRRFRAVYFLAVGGAGALLSKHIKGMQVIAYEDLGPEAIFLLELDAFPVLVCYDIYGGDLLTEGRRRWQEVLA
jgi:fumarate hydratase subunit beta